MKSTLKLQSIFTAWTALCLGIFLATIMPALVEGFHRAAWFWRVSPGAPGSIMAVIPAHAKSAGTVLLMAMAGLLAGRSFLAWAGVGRSGGFPVALTAGLALVLPALVFGLGLAGLFRGPLFTVLLVVAAIAASIRLRPAGIASAGWMAAIGAGILLAPSLLCALVPEIQYDALQYHLALPRRFLDAGRIYLADPWPHANFHLAMETMFAPAMALGGDGAAKLFNWLFFPLLLVLVRRAAQSAGATGASGHLPWIIIASSPLFSEVAGQTFTDNAAACAVASAVILRLARRPPAFAIGALIGAAGAVKLPSLAYGLALLPFLAPRGRIIPALAGWIMPVIIWPAKTFLLTGTPFGGIFLVGVWPSFLQGETIINFLRSGDWIAPGHHSLWLTLPLLLLRDAVQSGFEFSPFLPALLPLALLPAASRPPFLVKTVIASFILWPFTGGGQVRFLLPYIPLALVAGTAGNRLGGLVPPRLMRLGLVITAILGIIRTAAVLYPIGNPVNAALGMEDSRSYLARIITPTPIYMAAASRVRDNPRLGRPYVAGDIKSYYWPCNPRNDSQFLNPLLFRWARDSQSPRDLAAKFRQSGLGCVAHNLGGAITMGQLAGKYHWTARSLDVLQRFWASHMASFTEFETAGRDGWIYIWEFDYAGRVRFNPARSHWLQIPYTEWITMEADMALDKGKLGEAEKMYRKLAVNWPRYAVIPLRLAELSRLRGDNAAMVAHEKEVSSLIGAFAPQK